MKLDDQFLKAVVFLGIPSEAQHGEQVGVDLQGTGFFVSKVIDKNRDLAVVFLATAKHVALKLEKGAFAILVNTRSGGIAAVSFQAGNWIYHEDASVDVALLPMPVDELFDQYDIKWIGDRDFLTQVHIDENVIGLGDETQAIGLFSRVPGKERILPTVRTGAVAMLPNEKIPTKLGDTEAFLVEMRSLGGASGSPVLVRQSATGKTYLMGITHGHWDIPVSDEVTKAQHVNVGLAIVIPVKFIAEIMNHYVEVNREKIAEDIAQYSV